MRNSISLITYHFFETEFRTTNRSAKSVQRELVKLEIHFVGKWLLEVNFELHLDIIIIDSLSKKNYIIYKHIYNRGNIFLPAIPVCN